MDCSMAHMMEDRSTHLTTTLDTAYPHFNTDELYYSQNASEAQYPSWYLHYDYDQCNEREQSGSPCVPPSEPHWAYLTSRMPVMYDDALGYVSTTPQQVTSSALYSDRTWQFAPSVGDEMSDSARTGQFMSDAPVSPTFPAQSTLYKPLHTDEAFALMQRQSSNYVPSISVALDAPIRKSVDASVSPSRSPSPSPPTVPSPCVSPPSPVIKVEKPHGHATRSRSIKEAQGKPSSCSFTTYRFREAGTSEPRSDDDDVPLLPSITGDAIEKAKRGLARARRTQHLACFFCRRRKIACVAPDTNDPGRTCNQCERRGLSCSFPAESHRGLRHRSRDKKPTTQDEASP